MTPTNAIVISDEKETLQILKKFEEDNFMFIKIIGAADSVVAGIDIIKSKKPDVIFLDFILQDDHFFEKLE